MRRIRPGWRGRRLVAAGVGAVLLSAAVTARQASRPANGVGGRVHVETARVPLDPRDPARSVLGDFTFAGGLQLTSTETPALHGFSDLDVSGNGHLTAVSDFGSLLEATLVFDADQQLTGLADTRLTPLVGEDGTPLLRKSDADAEGLAILPDGARLVSFEGSSRILLYPPGGGRPHRVAMPSATFEDNGGMEAISADPDRAPDAYIVGHEITGETWSCRVSQTECTSGPTAPKSLFFGLVAMRRLPGGLVAYLLRTVDGQRRNRVILRILDGLSEVGKLDLSPPLTTDNFEGLAAVPVRDAVRFYLISDDNAATHQRTLLVAFDWRPR